MRRRILVTCMLALAGLLGLRGLAARAGEPGERAALPAERYGQAAIARGELTRDELRRMGLILFSTPYTRLDGYGGGPDGRPTLGGNGTFLRANGMDAQACLECHSVVRASSMPPLLGIGGVGGSNSNALIMPTHIDVGDADGDTIAGFDGRFANPPFLFGVGAVELLGLEMTAELQALKARALAAPGTFVELVSKGLHFGTIRATAAGVLDTSQVTGVRDDLVVRPFGRKGEFTTVRDFDREAMQFHFGMQPTEVVGEGVDADRDGIANEITAGDLSALHVFATSLERPYGEPRTGAARRGYEQFRAIGCSDCHVPELQTRSRHLPLRFPELATRPFENAYAQVDLAAEPLRFEGVPAGGVKVALFSDLRHHDMGVGLKETFAGADEETNRTFITARLWGVADTAPYLHDGRATTLTDAILAHGGEAEIVRDRFAALSDGRRTDLLAFLRSLRTPAAPAQGLLAWMKQYEARHAATSAKGRAAKSRKVRSRKSARGGAARRPATWWPTLLRRLLEHG